MIASTSTSAAPLSVAIDARIPIAAGYGGVETFLIALLRNLAALGDPSLQITAVCLPDYQERMAALLPDTVRIVPYWAPTPTNESATPASPPPSADSTSGPSTSTQMPVGSFARRIGRWLGVDRQLTMVRRELKQKLPAFKNRLESHRHAIKKLEADFERFKASAVACPLDMHGFWPGLRCDVVHFFVQSSFEVCSVPSVYNPHDLQHLHWPEYFSPASIASREWTFQAGCHFASRIAVASQWVKQDIQRQYHTDPAKIQVIPWAPTTSSVQAASTGQVMDTIHALGAHPPFILYPAMTWPHKNHLRLLEAIAWLRNHENTNVTVVCSGHQNDHWPVIESRIRELGLTGQVFFTGFVDETLMRGLYRECAFAVIPTLFEAASGPVFEAWEDGKAVACSNVTSLPQQVRDAAVLFDPLDATDIARGIKILLDPVQRSEFERKGTARLKAYSWTKTARAYHALYRAAARRTLSEEETELLHHDWMS